MRAIVAVINVVIAVSAIYLKFLEGSIHGTTARLYGELLDANLDMAAAHRIGGLSFELFLLDIVLALSATVIAAVLAHTGYYGRKTGRIVFSIGVISCLLALIMY